MNNNAGNDLSNTLVVRLLAGHTTQEVVERLVAAHIGVLSSPVGIKTPGDFTYTLTVQPVAAEVLVEFALRGVAEVVHLLNRRSE